MYSLQWQLESHWTASIDNPATPDNLDRQSSNTSPFLGRLLAMCQIVAAGGDVGIRNPSPGIPSLFFCSLMHHRLIGESIYRTWWQWGCILLKRRNSYECAGDERSRTGFESFPRPDLGQDFSLDKWQCRTCGISEEARRHGVYKHVQASLGNPCLVRAVHGQHHDQMHSREEKHSSRLVEPSGSDPSSGVQHMQKIQSFSHRSVCYQGECKAPYLSVTHSGSHGVEGRHFSILVERPTVSVYAFLPLTLLKQILSRVMISQNLFMILVALVTKGVVCRYFGSSGGRTTSHAVEPTDAAPHEKVSQEAGVAVPTHLETIKQLVCKAGFHKKVAEVIAMELRRSAACVYQGKRPRFPQVLWKDYYFMQGHCSADRRVLYIYLSKELRLLVPAIKGCGAAFNHVLTLATTDLTTSQVISIMFSSCKKAVFEKR